MECQEVAIRKVQFDGAPLHILTLPNSEEHMFSRAAEWALYQTIAHTGSLNRALDAASLPKPLLLRSGQLPEPINRTDFDAIMGAYRTFQVALDPTSNRPPKMISLVLVSSVGVVAVERDNRPLLEALDCEVPEQMQLEARQEELVADPGGPLVDLVLGERLSELQEISLQDNKKS